MPEPRTAAAAARRSPCPRAGRRHRGLGLVVQALLLATPPAAALPAGVALDDCILDAFGTAEGVHQGGVHALAVGREGFLWVGHGVGLDRFDGTTFELFGRERLGFPGPPAVDQLAVDGGGKLWALLREGVLIQIDPLRGGVATLPIQAVAGGVALGYGHSWLQTQPSGSLALRWGSAGLLELVDGALRPLAGADAALGVPPRFWLRQRAGLDWLVDSDGLRALTGAAAAPPPLAAAGCAHDIRGVLLGRGGRLWLALGGDGGVCRIDGAQVRRFRQAGHAAPPGEQPIPLHEDADGALWFGTATGVGRVVGEAVTSRRVPDLALGVAALAEDAEGSVWVGARQHGVFRLRATAVATFGAAAGVPDTVSALLPEADGGVTFATYESTVVRWNGTPRRIYGEADGVPAGGLWSLAREATGTLLAGGDDGVVALEGERFVRRHGEALPPGSRIARMLATADGALWVATPQDVVRFAGAAVTRWPMANLADFVVAPGGAVVGVSKFGVQELLEGGALRPMTDASGQPLPGTRRLAFDEEGAAWLHGVDGRLGRLRQGELRWFGAAQGIPDVAAHAMILDRRGGLWLSSDVGLYRGDLAVLRRALDRSAEPSGLRALERGDGLLVAEFNGGDPCAALDGRGRLVFASAGGIVRVDVARTQRNEVPPPVHIVALRLRTEAGERALPLGQPLRLGPERYELAIDYVGISLRDPQRVRYVTQLVGLDGAEVDVGARRTAYLARLPAGSYRFAVHAIQGDGVRSATPATLDFEVAPRWLERRPVQGLLGLGGVLALAVLWRLRLRQLRARQRALEHLIAERTQDLADERARSLALLRNVLPASIAARLEAGETPIADSFAEVSILFADLADFTVLATRWTPEQLVAALDEIFTAFDAIVAAEGAEKIKTIGDAYMAVAGVPAARPDHAETMARVGLRLLASVEAYNAAHGTALGLRVGIHSGPVVAGVLGRSRLSYDIWGDAVNTASRMESHGVVGRVQVTEATAALLGGAFRLTWRGDVEVKGKGRMRVALVGG